MTDDVLQMQREGRFCTLVLNRPERKNSLSPELLYRLKETLDQLVLEDDVRAVIIRGSGEEAFCAGYDLNVLPTGEDAKGGKSEESLNPFEVAMEAIAAFPYPVIAMMNGYAFGGGCDLAVSCDIRIGADDIRIGMVPVKLGVVYSAAGLKRFMDVIGLARTQELFFTGRQYQAPFLKEIGFLNHMIPRGELQPFTLDLAREISENAPLALKGTKRVLQLIRQAAPLGEAAIAEAESISRHSFLSEDLKEGRQAFFEKRQPIFKGR